MASQRRSARPAGHPTPEDTEAVRQQAKYQIALEV